MEILFKLNLSQKFSPHFLLFFSHSIFRISKLREKSDAEKGERMDAKSFAKLATTALNAKDTITSIDQIKLSPRDWQLILTCATTVIYQQDRCLRNFNEISHLYIEP